MRDESDENTGKYALSVECLSGVLANTKINVDEEQNIISIEGFGDLSRFYDRYYTENIVIYTYELTEAEDINGEKLVVRKEKLDSYVQEISLNGHQIFDINWCQTVGLLKDKKFVRKENDTEWLEL